MKIRNKISRNLSIVALVLLASLAASAQTTAFSFQGRLTDTGTPQGTYQMQFKLFDAVSGGTQIGMTQTDLAVAVTQGNFKVKLDFGASVFTGANRWLEVGVRRNSGESYTILDPREQVASSPYSLRTLSAAQADDAQKLGGVNASEYVTSTNTAGNGFIKNQTAPQAASNFNVTGSGTVGSLTSGGAVSIGGTAAPGTAPAGQGRLYFDSTANKFKISENGAAFVNLVGASGVSGSGTVNRLPLFSAATALADSVIAQSGTNIGIGTTTPTAKLAVGGSGVFNAPNAARFDIFNTTFGGGFLQHVTDTGLWQIATTGTALSRMVIAPSGNVGIGTVAPGAKLEVGGAGVQQRITDTTSGNSLVLQGGSGENMKVTAFNYGTGTAIPLNLSVDGANTYLNPNGGLVGIGMTSPTHALDVNGFFRARHVAGGNVVSETTGGVNSWAKLWMRTPVQSWSIGSSNTFNGNQLYFANESTGAIHMFIMPNGNVGIGNANPTEKLNVAGTTKTNILQITGGSDLAENFEVADKVKPGMIVAIDPKNAGKLVLSRGAYNRQVAGIISGANNLSAGMLLPDLKEGKNSMPVALSGRVWVYADASKSSIRPGDLLTTSGKPGHAMKVTNHKRASGAIIGKAMSELKSGPGLVLVLVSLQ